MLRILGNAFTALRPTGAVYIPDTNLQLSREETKLLAEVVRNAGGAEAVSPEQVRQWALMVRRGEIVWSQE